MLVDPDLDQLALDDPVDLAIELVRVGIEAVEHVLPHMDRLLVVVRDGILLDVLLGHLAVFALDLDRRVFATVVEAELALAGRVVGDVLDRLDRVAKREVLVDVVVLDHLEDDRSRPDLHEVGVLAHVRVADDHVQPAILLAVGMRLVAGIDDRAIVRRRARDLLIDVLGALTDAVVNAVLGLEDLARAGVDLARHEERDQLLGEVVEIDVAIDEVVLVAAVAVAHEVRVVLEDRELPGNALFADLLLGVDLEIFEDPLTGLVVDRSAGSARRIRASRTRDDNPCPDRTGRRSRGTRSGNARS